MRCTLLFALVLLLAGGEARAQTGGAPSGGAAGASGAAPSAPGSRSATPTSPTAGAPAASSGAPLNTDVFPPSRGLPTPAPSAAAPAPGGGTPPAGTAAPGAPIGPDPNLPATASGGRAQPGGANASAQSSRTGKNSANDRYADCVNLWDAKTHMSKSEWSRTCRRIDNRLKNLQVENLNSNLSGPKPRKSGRSSGGSG
jgi:hypothetical protein